MGAIVEVTSPTFEEAVLEQSYQMPVVIDFYAQWCGPCQMLKPLLEKLTQEYEFTLAKVDIDQSPELARIYHVEGVPDVKVAVKGEMFNGFVGMLDEGQLRSFLEQLNLKSQFEEALAELATIRTTGDRRQLQEKYAELLRQYPDRPQLLLDAAQFYLSQKEFDEAIALLDRIDPLQKPYGDQAQAVRSLMEFHQTVAELSPDSEADELYLAGAKAAIAGDYEAGLAQFLALVQCDRKYRADAGRKSMLTLFNLLGNDHPLTQTYRKQLMQTLY
ncbi:tetratricopeptide repeat protein [Leptolyngbya iicbica]|uniref:Co-chaperone YbbN n=2 Tax=Cyanophyceae TaxID=3028117 RepID=A0A4Q7E070_9CYAN|nr:tetratricopeptide repeat protein [Leptolyngbya sp. LK]RZM74717.1 co-chaperone YbbN [Leptolyngbya sp. LK]